MDAIAQSNQLSAIEPAAERVAGAPPFWPGFLLAIGATCITVGTMWDISWHETIGRDTFWTPAHMMIYLGGTLAGCIGGWLAIYYTFLAGPDERAASVHVFGARAPLGAWLAIWGAVAMLTSGPFDNWWHNAYGLDVKIISPPHTVLGMGMFGITLGALVLVLSRQNRFEDGTGGGLFVYVGGIFLTMAAVFIMEYDFPNEQHASLFYKVCALQFPLRLVTMARAGRVSFPATRMAAVYILIACLMSWILPLFPAQPKLAPIYNPINHMVPPPFPMLLIFPALAIDFVLYGKVEARGWRRVGQALLVGAVFTVVFIAVQWYFSEFLLSPKAANWFFVGGNRPWDYGSKLGDWITEFWRSGDLLFTPKNLATCWVFAAATSWLGLLLGGWMRKVQR